MYLSVLLQFGVFFFQAEDGIRDVAVTGVQTCALPISFSSRAARVCIATARLSAGSVLAATEWMKTIRSEEHTSELQSRLHLVCRLLLEKKKIELRTPRLPSNPYTCKRVQHL